MPESNLNKTEERVNDTKLQYRYKIERQLGKGSFGDVYLMRDREDGQYYAGKFEKLRDVSRLFIEYKTYRHLEKHGPINGVPRVYQFFQTADYNVMLMDQLGNSLDQLFDQQPDFNIDTTIHIACQILRLIRAVHETGIIHRDIKPNNFIFGKQDPETLYILDFGLSRRYINKKGVHMPSRTGRSLIGTARYASINMHMGLEPSRRDDLESIGYMLVYLVKGRLPWQGFRKKKGKSDLKRIGECKMSTKVDDLCADLPACFGEYLKYAHQLKFDETPDYTHLIKLFDSENKDKGTIPDSRSSGSTPSNPPSST